MRAEYAHRELILIDIKDYLLLDLFIDNQLLSFDLAVSPSIFQSSVCDDFDLSDSAFNSVVFHLEVPNEVIVVGFDCVEFAVIADESIRDDEISLNSGGFYWMIVCVCSLDGWNASVCVVDLQFFDAAVAIVCEQTAIEETMLVHDTYQLSSKDA